MLTTGEAPEDLRQIFKQRSRWCTGCFLTPTLTLTLILTRTLTSASRLDVYLAVWAMSGIFAATFPLAFAYISDHVPAPSLVQAYGITLGCGLGLAMMLGPISGALLASACGTRAVFLLSLLITLCNGGLAACFMREESGHLRLRHLG